MNKNKTPETAQSAGKKRRYKIGVISVLTTIFVILAIIAVNYFFDYLSYRFVLQIDMTSNSLYEVTDDTANVLKTLKEPISITVLADETTYQASDTLNPIREILKKYEILSGGSVTVQYVNPNVNPQLLEKYDQLGTVSSNDIIVESARRYKHLTPTNLYELVTDDSGNYYVTGLRAEQRLTSAVLYVTAEKVPKAAYIIGHQETTNLTNMESLLTSGNYEITQLNLGIEGTEIENDVDLIVISQPMSDYSAVEIEKIDAFFENEGRAIVLFSPQTPYLERLERYFEEWGVKVTSDLVMDATQCLAGYPTYVIPDIEVVEGITDNLNKSSIIAVPGARAMKTLFSENEWRYTTVLLKSSSNSYSKSLAETITSYDQDASDPTGPFPLMILSSQNRVTNMVSHYSHIMFINAGMVADSALKMENLLNKNYFVSALNYISTDEDTVIIAAKEITASTLSISGGQVRVLFWILIILIPLGALLIGCVVWVRRRHL